VQNLSSILVKIDPTACNHCLRQKNVQVFVALVEKNVQIFVELVEKCAGER